jgi:hypothetical protein
MAYDSLVQLAVSGPHVARDHLWPGAQNWLLICYLLLQAYMFSLSEELKKFAIFISVSIVSDHTIDDRGSIPAEAKIFPLASVSRPALRPTQPPVQWV